MCSFLLFISLYIIECLISILENWYPFNWSYLGLVDWCLLNFRTLEFHEYSGLAYYIHSGNNGYKHLRCQEAPLHGNWRRPVRLAMMDNVGQCCLAASHQNQRYCSKARNDNSVRDYTQTCNAMLLVTIVSQPLADARRICALFQQIIKITCNSLEPPIRPIPVLILEQWNMLTQKYMNVYYLIIFLTCV